MAESHYCLQCGTQMVLEEIEGRPREVCPACGWIHYLQLKVGAGVVIEQEGKVLLLQRAHAPWVGAWNLPAGYAEVNEEPAETAIRETLEETGLQIKPLKLLGTYFYDDDLRGNGLMLLYAVEIVGGELLPNEESQTHRFFAPDEVPEHLAGGGHNKAVVDWKNGRFRIRD